MTSLQYIRSCIIASCISFTVEVVGFVIMPDTMAPVLNAQTILQTFVICIIGSFAALSPVYINKVWTLKEYVISYILLMCTIFGIGHVIFQLIPIEWGSTIGIVGCSFVIYALCSWTLFKKEQLDAEEINKHLANVQKIKKEGHGNDADHKSYRA